MYVCMHVCSYVCMYVCMYVYITGFWKTDQNVTFGLFHFICTVALPGLVDWSAFLEQILLTM